MFNCCPSWLPTPIGNIKEISILEAMESETAKAIRASMEAGEYRYCSKEFCPSLNTYLNSGELSGDLVDKEDPNADFFSTAVDRHIEVNLCYEESCNLACPSCRSEKVLRSLKAIPADILEVHQAFERNLEDMLKKKYFVRLGVTGIGDAFGSPLYYSLLKNLKFHSRLSLSLQTNGVLMEEHRFTDAMLKTTKKIIVSVDAATKETYEKVRVGGSFEKLMKNLAWVNSARLAGKFPKLKHFNVNMVVQKDNYREMGDFVRGLKQFEAIDKIWFNKITAWDHMSASTFFEKAVWREEHPEHKEFLEQMGDHDLLSDPRVLLGNLSAYVNKPAAPLTAVR